VGQAADPAQLIDEAGPNTVRSRGQLGGDALAVPFVFEGSIIGPAIMSIHMIAESADGDVDLASRISLRACMMQVSRPASALPSTIIGGFVSGIR
jgi:hypothetical protein